MRKITAIALLTLRSAVRSRVVASLVVLLALVIIGLPLTMQSDGTIGGHVQVVVTYTLGAVVLLLSIVTLWAACAAVSQEVADRQIHLVVTKPVARSQIWLGKWLGLLALNAALLAVSGVTVYTLLRWTTARADLDTLEQEELNEHILVARRQFFPVHPDVSAEVNSRLAAATRDASVSPGFSEETARAAIRKALLTQRYSAAPGEQISWRFPMPPLQLRERPLQVEYRFDSSALGAQEERGRWMVGPPDAEPAFEQAVLATPGMGHTFAIPPEVLRGAGDDLILRFVNESERDTTVLFPPDDGVQVLAHAGSFEMNLLRALLVQFAHLAFLAALGVTAGSMFSLPVAALASAYFMILLKVAPYIQAMAKQSVYFADTEGSAAAPGLLDYVTGALFRSLQFVLAPLETANVLDLISLGYLVPWNWVAAAFAVRVLLYGTIIAGIGIFIFRHRELGLPS